jgi:hypothetical protein
MDNMRYATPMDPYFKRTFDQFVVDCFFYDVLMGNIDLNAFLNSNNILLAMTPQTSAPVQTTVYSKATPMGSPTTCETSYTTNIVGAIGAQATTSLTTLNTLMNQDVTGKLVTVANSFLNIGAGSATDVITQAMAANAVKEGLQQTSLYTGVSADAIMYASSLAEQQQTSSWIVAGDLSKKYLPILRQIFEAMIYGLFPILFLMMMTPFAMKAFRLYFGLLIWLLLWSPLFALLNLIVNTRTTGVLAPSYGFFSLGQMPYIYQSTSDLVAMAGYLAWSVPTIAFAVAKGSDSAIVNLLSSIQGSTNLTTAHSASAVTGPEGAQRMAAANAHFKAAELMSSNGVAGAQSALAFSQISYGKGLSSMGDGQLMEAGKGKALAETTSAIGTAAAIDNQGVDSAIKSASNQGQSNIQQGLAIGGGGYVGKMKGTELKAQANAIEKSYESWTQGHSGSMEDMLTASETTGMTKTVGDRQAYKDAVGTIADKIQQETGMGRSEALAGAQNFLSRANVERSVGGDIGWKQAYDNATEKGLFTGSFTEYASYQAKMGSIKDFSDNFSLQKVAGSYFGGDVSQMLSERANYHNTQAASALTKLNEHGYTSERAGRYLGEINALSSIAQSEFYQRAGDKGVLTSEGGRLEDQLAKYQTLQTAAMVTGKMTGPDDMAGFNTFLRDYHGVDVKYADKDGINTTNVTSDGKMIYSEMRGAWNLTTADKKGNPAHDKLVQDIKKQNPNFEAIDGATFHVAWRGGRYETLSTAHSMSGAVSQQNNRNELRAMNVEETGGTTGKWVVPDGRGGYRVEEGVKRWDPDLKQNVIVAANRTYGINDSEIMLQDAKYDAKGALISPAGVVYMNTQVDPRTGRAVAGKTTSVLLTEGQINANGKTFNATIFEDTRSGVKLAMDAKSGNFYMATRGSEAWTYQMDLDTRGKITASGLQKGLEKLGVSPERAQDIGYKTGIGMGAASEIGGVLAFIHTLRAGMPTGGNPDAQGPYSKWPPDFSEPVPPSFPKK